MKEFKNSNLFQDGHGPGGGSGPSSHGRVMVEAVLARDFKAIKIIMATKVVIANNTLRGVNSSNNRVIRATRSS